MFNLFKNKASKATDNTQSSSTIVPTFYSFRSFSCPSHLNHLKDYKDLEDHDQLNRRNKEQQYTGIKKYGGMISSLVSSLCFAVIVLLVKILRESDFDSSGAAFWRYVGITFPSIPLLIFYCYEPVNKKKEGLEEESVFDTIWPIFKDDHWKTWIGLLAAGIIGSTSTILRYYSLQYLSVGDIIVIMHSTPVFVTFMAHIFLGEKCGVVPSIIAFITLIGVIIVSKPPLIMGAGAFAAESGTLVGAGLALGSVFLTSVSTIITRKIRKVHFAVMTLIFGVTGVALVSTVSSQSLGLHSVPVGLYESLLVAGVAGLSFVSTMANVLALKFERAGPVSLIRSCDVIFGFLLQLIFLNVAPDIYSWIGATVVLFGVLLAVLRKYVEMLPEGDSKKSKWSWFMK